MKTVAVTGGAGFIGSNLTHRLITEGYEVVVVHLKTPSGVVRLD